MMLVKVGRRVPPVRGAPHRLDRWDALSYHQMHGQCLLDPPVSHKSSERLQIETRDPSLFFDLSQPQRLPKGIA